MTCDTQYMTCYTCFQVERIRRRSVEIWNMHFRLADIIVGASG